MQLAKEIRFDWERRHLLVKTAKLTISYETLTVRKEERFQHQLLDQEPWDQNIEKEKGGQEPIVLLKVQDKTCGRANGHRENHEYE